MGSRKFLDPLNLPNLTSTQRDALSGVSDGDIIYNTTLGYMQQRANGLWVPANVVKSSGNLLVNANFADPNTTSPWAVGAGPGGVTNANLTIARTTAQVLPGQAYSALLTADGVHTFEGTYQNVYGAEPNTTYVFSVWLRLGTLNSPIVIGMRDQTNSVDSTEVDRTLTTTWTRWYQSMTTGATGPVQLSVFIDTNNSFGTGTFYAACAQLEIGDTPMPWEPYSRSFFFGSNSGIYGDGSDGVVNFDGTTTVLGLAPSSGTYTLTRDIYLADGSQVSGTGNIKTAGFRIFCTGVFTIRSGRTVQNNGNAGSGSSAGGGTANGTISLGTNTAGGAGGSGTTGTAGTALTNACGAAGGAGGIATGSGTGGGPAGGTVTAPTAALGGLPRNQWAAMSGRTLTAVQFSPGSGGGGGTAAASSTGGGGGSGAGGVGIYAAKLVNLGTISANGGNGGNGGGTGTGGGGGGGGGGGYIIIICGPGSTTGTLSVAGGNGGTRQGVGANGAAGSTGNTFIMEGVI